MNDIYHLICFDVYIPVKPHHNQDEKHPSPVTVKVALCPFASFPLLSVTKDEFALPRILYEWHPTGLFYLSGFFSSA